MCRKRRMGCNPYESVRRILCCCCRRVLYPQILPIEGEKDQNQPESQAESPGEKSEAFGPSSLRYVQTSFQNPLVMSRRKMQQHFDHVRKSTSQSEEMDSKKHDMPSARSEGERKQKPTYSSTSQSEETDSKKHDRPSTGSEDLKVDDTSTVPDLPPQLASPVFLNVDNLYLASREARLSAHSTGANSISTFASACNTSRRKSSSVASSANTTPRKRSSGTLHLIKNLVAAAPPANGGEDLMDACGGGSFRLAQKLIRKGADPSYQCEDGWTPMHLASAADHTDIVMLLVDSGAQLDAVDFAGRTPLWWACYNGHVETVRYLLERGANKDMADEEGFFPGDKFCREEEDLENSLNGSPHSGKEQASATGNEKDQEEKNSTVFTTVPLQRQQDVLDVLRQTEKRISEVSTRDLDRQGIDQGQAEVVRSSFCAVS